MNIKKLKLILEIILLPITNASYLGAYDSRYFTLRKNDPLVIRSVKRTAQIETLDEVDLIYRKYISELTGKKRDSESLFHDLFEVYGQLADELLEYYNGEVTIKDSITCTKNGKAYGFKGYSPILIWNHLNRGLSTDFLCILYLIKNGYDKVEYLEDFYGDICLEDAQLKQLLRQGIAETHMHFNASNSFTLVWERMMVFDHLQDKNARKQFEFFNHDIEKIELWINVMAVLRMLATNYLSRVSDYLDFFSFLKNAHCTCGSTPQLTTFFNIYLNHELEDINLYSCIDFNAVSKELKDNRCHVSCRFAQEIYSANQEDRLGTSNRNSDQILYYSSVSTMPVRTYAEYVFLFKLIKHLNRCDFESSDSKLANFLRNYLIIKNNVYRSKVEMHDIKGLDAFKEYFESSKVQYPKRDPYMLFIKQLRDINMKKLEIRLGMNDNLSKQMYTLLSTYREVLKNHEEIQCTLGIVFHLFKRAPVTTSSCIQTYWAEGNSKELHYTAHRLSNRSDCERLLKLLDDNHMMRHFVVGLDAASGENDAEPWVFADLYRYVRKSYSLLLGKTKSNTLRDISFSFHVGEDFRHLMSGLRHIDEVLNHFDYRSGDRIGHGIALGVCPKTYRANTSEVYIPKGEMLDNYLWLWNLLNNNFGEAYLYRGYIEDKIRALVEDIYQDEFEFAFDVNLMHKAYLSRFYNDFTQTEQPLEIIGQNCQMCVLKTALKQNQNDVNLIYSTFACHRIINKLNEVICVEISENDVAIMTFAQNHIVKEIENRGIVVEINPTSNSVIGEIDNLFENHIMKLNTKFSTKAVVEPRSVITTINSDDPSVFSTTTSSEFAYIYHALLDKGYPKDDVLEWMDRLRRNGMNSCFIPDYDWQSYLKLLDEMIDSLHGGR